MDSVTTSYDKDAISAHHRTVNSAHAKNRLWYLPEKIGFPGWCVRVCRPYDSCKSFGKYYYYLKPYVVEYRRIQ